MKSAAVYFFSRFKIIGSIFLCLAIHAKPASAQYQLRLVITNESGQHNEEQIFVAGNFNNWNPGKDSFSFEKETNTWILLLPNLSSALYEFKFTRGSWPKVECSNSGLDIANRAVLLNSDTTLFYTIKAWKDDFKEVEKKHTASAHVSVLDTSFFIPQLNRSRKITIYLPEGYGKTSKRYPVLYMHDGQNLFDEFITSFGEWGVDESLDSLIKKGRTACIVVAIDNGPKRLNEYNPFYFERAGEGEGELYVKFLVETLKPYIDKKYKTLQGKENTMIAGSSMGGLISYYAMLKYSNVFGKAGIFSPAFWTSEGIKQLTDSLGRKVNGKLFFYMGALEGGTYVEDMLEISEKLGDISTASIYIAIDANGNHNEQAWRKWFTEFFLWVTADGNNYIIHTSD